MEITVEEMKLNYEPTFLFDRTNPNWNPNLEYNVVYLRAVQNYMNDCYRARGHLFLNEIYDHMGMPRTGAGAVLGWVYGESENVLLDFEAYKDGSGTIAVTVNPLGVILDCIDPDGVNCP